MTSKQRIALWRRVSQCFDRHERAMIKEDKKMKSRIDVIGQNGNDGEHYAEVEKAQLNNRGNWYGLADDWDKEEDATSMHDDLPSAAEDCAKQRGNYEI
tara:strand:+ start:902 stop:1198 length:297 start_codon:yes stop_codon:yes gene_type:complete